MIKGLVIRRVLIVLLIGSLGIAASNYLFVMPSFFKRSTSYLVYPVLVIQQRFVIPLKAWFEEKQTIAQLQQQLIKAQDEAQQLQATIMQMQATNNFAEDIQEVMQFKQRYICAQAMLCQVLVRHISDQGHFFILDAGEQKGIKKNMVAVYKNNLLGKVIEVYPCYSKLLLVTDKTCKVSAYCAKTRASGIHAGAHNGNETVLLHVSHLATVEEDDLIYSSGDGLIFPRGFALARITGCKRNDLFYEITAQTMLDLHKISYCYLLEKGTQAMSYLDDSIVTPSAPVQPQS